MDFVPETIGASISIFAPFSIYPHFLHIQNLPPLLQSSSPSIRTQQSAFHISQTWVHKPLLAPSTLFSPLKNTDTSRQSRCIKSICRLNLLQGEVQIRPAARDRFLLPRSKTCRVCLLSSTARTLSDGQSSSQSSLRLNREHTTNQKTTLLSQLKSFYLHALGYSCNIKILNGDDRAEGKKMCVNAKRSANHL